MSAGDRLAPASRYCARQPSKLEHVRIPVALTSAVLSGYQSRFGNWEARASVRTKPRRILDEHLDGKLFFPTELGARQRTAIGAMLPEFIRAFLAPDTRVLSALLRLTPLDRDTVR